MSPIGGLHIGATRVLVTVDNPRTDANGVVIRAPDGDGGFLLTYDPAPQPEWWAAIDRAGVRRSEQLFAGTVVPHTSYILRGRYHPDITTQTRLTWTDRGEAVHVTNVLDVQDPEGAGVETLVLCNEIAT